MNNKNLKKKQRPTNSDLDRYKEGEKSLRAFAGDAICYILKQDALIDLLCEEYNKLVEKTLSTKEPGLDATLPRS